MRDHEAGEEATLDHEVTIAGLEAIEHALELGLEGAVVVRGRAVEGRVDHRAARGRQRGRGGVHREVRGAVDAEREEDARLGEAGERQVEAGRQRRAGRPGGGGERRRRGHQRGGGARAAGHDDRVDGEACTAREAHRGHRAADDPDVLHARAAPEARPSPLRGGGEAGDERGQPPST